MKRIAFLLGAAALLLLSACSGLVPAAEPTPAPSLAPTETGTPTATIVWFPPTSTPTPRPPVEPSPTLEMRPGLGNLLLADNFDQPALWDTIVSATANLIVERNRLTLTVVGAPNRMLTSLRSEPALGSFYAEVNARLSLCKGADQYGMLFRVSSEGDFYRYVLSCRGETRLERVRGGTSFPLQDWKPSGSAPRGSPGEVRLGVWASGSEMRFFLNDEYQFSVVDRVFSDGRLGMFVRPEGANAMTVVFSDLVVYSVAYASPTPSPTPAGTKTP